MDTISANLGTAGPGHALVIGDKTYYLTQTTEGMKAKYSEELVSRTRKSILETASECRAMAKKKFDEAKEIQRQSEDATKDTEPAFREAYETTIREARALERESKDMVDRFNDRRAAGEYEFHGAAGLESMGSLPGMLRLARIMLEPKHPKITEAEVIEIFKNSLDENGNSSLRDAILEVEAVQEKKAQ